MYDFQYHKPSDLAAAASLFGQAEDGLLMAGGQTLIPTLKQRLAQPSDVIDLGAIDGLDGITQDGNTIVVGAMTTHAEVAGSDIVAGSIPALADLAEAIGDPQVRNRGTMGGSIANNDPAADYPAGLVGLGATITTTNRQIAADDFFTGMFETALDGGEIITSVSFPIPTRAAYMKLPNPASRYAIVGVFVAQSDDGVRVAVTGAGPCVFRVAEMESALASNFSADAVANIEISQDGLNSDIHAGRDYRAAMVTVMAKRAVAKIG
ncbi:MAG: xanthine dehydrogenase family protein subunit M [Alphaproteobacteria bacterium]|nr:xanthine dehydrogenase family protein subunit M [Alphaproteobacteria bacterium]